MLSEQTFEFGQARLVIKPSLRFTMRQSGSETRYIVEDEATGKFFQIGLPQYTFLSMLNGSRTVNSALMRTASLLRQHAIDEQEAANLCKWAIESGLVETELSNSASRREKKDSQEAVQKSMSWLNPVMLKIPLFEPDAMVTVAERFAGWMVSAGGLLIWLIVVCYGFFQLAVKSDVFIGNRISSFGPDDLLWLAVAWLALKLVHEMAHAIVCKRYGGRVQTCGLLFLLLIPLPYVDVTSSWRFNSKWKRIWTSAAGMMSEIFIGAIACCVWAWSNPGPLQYHAGNVIISATVHTLLFNLNPLMRFDGYYMLCDLLSIPNLSTHGRQHAKSFFSRVYFGKKANPISEIGWKGLVVKVYGFLAIGWFFLIAVGLSLGASSLMDGFGLLIVVVAMGMWFGIPLVKGMKFVFAGTKLEKPNRIWFATACSITVVAIGGFLYLCPGPSVVSAPVVFDYEPLSIVRAETSGFADKIHVRNGQQVDSGDLLLTMSNPKLISEYRSHVIDIKVSELRIKSFLKTEQIASVKLEQETLDSLHKRKIELDGLIRKLEIRATSAGTVLEIDLDDKLGTYMMPGDEVLTIGKLDEIQAVALVRQEDIRWIKEIENSEVKLFVSGRSENEIVSGRIHQITPRAREDLPHSAFAASNGGPLAVVPREQVDPNATSSADEDSVILTDPRVMVEVSLDVKDRSLLRSGQPGVMFIRGRQESMGQYLVNNFSRFVRHNNLRTHGL